MEKAEKPVPFEEFTRERTNNFYGHFIPGDDWWGGGYRNLSHYKAFEQERPDLAKKLRDAYEFLKDEPFGEAGIQATAERRANFERTAQKNLQTFEDNKEALYEAYLIMRKYADDKLLIND